MAVKKVLFLNLKAFSFTGGIEKFNRAFLKALADIDGEGNIEAHGWSVYDGEADERYFPNSRYKGFRGKRLRFVFDIITSAFKFDTVILSHINLSFVAYPIKLLFPSKKIIVVTHGIEVWDELKGFKKKLLKKADKILAVSAFTKQRIASVHGIAESRISIFHNTLDPYFIYPTSFNKPEYLMKRYSLHPRAQIVFTLTRLTSTEKNKGYDHVIQVMPQLKKKYPQVRYFLGGKPDEKEKKRINNLVETNNITDCITLPGFISDEEVADHYLLADVFILPSQKEGFGIVFIEAMACGLPVIAGNKDGSVDALRNGELGTLLNPDSDEEILQGLDNVLHAIEKNAVSNAKKELQQKVIDAFGFEVYKKRLREVLRVY